MREAYYEGMLNVAKIDLSAIRENANKIKAILPKNTAFCAVVKADAYGHGAERVSETLHGIADCFAVAITEEGTRLRRAGITEDILVFNPVSLGDYFVAAEHRLTVCVGGVSEILSAERAGRSLGLPVKTHLKINTGMNRGGAEEKDFKKILSLYTRCGCTKLCGVFSHYGAPENDELFLRATEKFRQAVKKVKSFDKNVTAHISASGGFIRGAYFDMVRIGILLYGYKPFKSDALTVRPAMKIFAPVIYERDVCAGETLLYGTERLSENARARIIRYGYADGLPREKTAFDIAARCMDVSAEKVFDNVPRGGENNACGKRDKKKAGKRLVKVLDNAEVLAEKYNTISYEILTKSAARAEKIYIDESKK